MSSLAAVFQIGSLGDSIVSLPTLLSIREFIPGCTEYLLISRNDSKLKVAPADIFEMAWAPKAQLNYSSQLRQLYTVPFLLAKLRYYRPRYCVSLMPAEREPERVARDIRFFKAGGVKELLGFQALPLEDPDDGSDIRIEKTEAYKRFHRLWGDAAQEKFKNYARVPVMQPPEESSRRVAQWLNEKRRYPHKPLIAVSPYSNFQSRDIPEHTIALLISQLTSIAGAEIVIVGGAKDFERAEAITKLCPAINASGVFSIKESAALLQQCRLAICTESGPMHLASAIGVPLLVTFSRINKQLSRWLPFGQTSTILYRDVPCAGCFSQQCPVAGHPCMEGISAADIVHAALALLSDQPVHESSLQGTRIVSW